MPEELEQIKPEDRKKLVITENAVTWALDMESLDKQLRDLAEEMIDIEEMQQVLAAKIKIVQGKRDSIRAQFWKNIRADEKPWFRKMSEADLQIVYKRVKNPELSNQSQIELTAIDPNEEAYKAIKRIFRQQDEDNRRG